MTMTTGERIRQETEILRANRTLVILSLIGLGLAVWMAAWGAS